MFCKRCGTQISDTASFCPGCGSKIERKAAEQSGSVCHACGAALKAGVKFCKNCGVRVAASQTRMENVCAGCGMPLKAGVKFCRHCGMAVSASKAEPQIARCTCGEPLKAGTRFCKACGKDLAAGAAFTEKPLPAKEMPRAQKPIDAVAKNAPLQAKPATASHAAKKVFEPMLGMVAAQKEGGECLLPTELNLIAAPIATRTAQSLPALLFGGIKTFFSNLLGVFKSGRKLITLLALGAVWVAVNLLQAKGVDSEILDLLSKITAAGGSIGVGTISKGFVAALVCTLFGESGFFKKLFRGIGQLFSSFGKGRGSFGGLLLGTGAALLLCRLMGVGELAPAVLPVSGVLLALRSLGGNGYIRRILGAILPKRSPAATSVLSGWTLGFALGIPLSAYALLIGGICMAAGIVFSILFRGKKEAVSA